LHKASNISKVLLEEPLQNATCGTHTAAPPPPLEKLPDILEDDKVAKARRVFGSREAGVAQRREEINKKSTLIAGILVPPKPEEPDNCCMSGCVNCVWDRFRDEIEEWAAASGAANKALRAMKGREGVSGFEGETSHVATSMDDDGGGSETLWAETDAGSGGEDYFENIPVGIREFMKTEKKLKAKHLADGTSGGPVGRVGPRPDSVSF
jgi:Oxidoreductase-like protein, N-terminal